MYEFQTYGLQYFSTQERKTRDESFVFSLKHPCRNKITFYIEIFTQKFDFAYFFTRFTSEEKATNQLFPSKFQYKN